MSKKIEEYSKLFEDFSPINVLPSRYDSINIVFNKEELRDDMNNVLRIMPFHYSIATQIIKGKPYTISAYLLNEKQQITQTKINISFFAGNISWWRKLFPLDTVITIIGKPKLSEHSPSFIHPKKIENSNEYFSENYLRIGSKFEPIYKKYGVVISNAEIQKKMLEMITTMEELPNDAIKTLNQYSTFSIKEALKEIHSPTSKTKLDNAKKNLAILEYISYKSTLQKINEHKAMPLNFKTSIEVLQKHFQYPLTNGQKSAINAIENFQQTAKGKLFLLQGDVGCGKTIIAINSAINVVNAGFQVAVLAPTQILAMQLFHTFNQILTEFNIKCELLINKDKARSKKEKIEGIKSGTIKVIIGTHAIFSKNIEFNNLGFIIIDEQHKFGVSQRLELMKKSQNAKCLLMTATPIPRTLSMSMYSGIEYFSIKEKPQNRMPIKTSVLSVKKAGEILSSAKKHFGNDFKMYWVCPLIDSENEAKSNITERKEFLLKYFSSNEIISVHGKMKEDAINNAIINFKEDPSVRILLATTIVEVGIDVPKANIIIIESAETFGLASLHQLRGRVGRNSQQGYCILLFDSKLSENATKRLEAMKKSNDGFYISEVDRKIRGSGNILGDEQSGAMHFNFFNENDHQDLIPIMEEICNNISLENKEIISKIFQQSTSLEYSFN